MATKGATSEDNVATSWETELLQGESKNQRKTGFCQSQRKSFGESTNKMNRKLNSPPFASHVSPTCTCLGEDNVGTCNATAQQAAPTLGSRFACGCARGNRPFSPEEVHAASQVPSVPERVALAPPLQLSPWPPAQGQGHWPQEAPELGWRLSGADGRGVPTVVRLC